MYQFFFLIFFSGLRNNRRAAPIRSRDYEHNKQESQEDEAKLQTEAMRRCAMRSILKGMQQRRDALDSPGGACGRREPTARWFPTKASDYNILG